MIFNPFTHIFILHSGFFYKHCTNGVLNKKYHSNNKEVCFDWHVGRKEGNVLFNDALNTFYLRLYGVGNWYLDLKTTLFMLK